MSVAAASSSLTNPTNFPTVRSLPSVMNVSVPQIFFPASFLVWNPLGVHECVYKFHHEVRQLISVRISSPTMSSPEGTTMYPGIADRMQKDHCSCPIPIKIKIIAPLTQYSYGSVAPSLPPSPPSRPCDHKGRIRRIRPRNRPQECF
ncbi:UNVERIFIED_CONTAM: hypothetical protein GTU68_025585 [Idotea baltica]|nr:hypothetical protein [Idotea baltica]